MPPRTLALFGLLLVPVVGLTWLSRPLTRPVRPPQDADRRLKWVAELPAPAPAWPDQPRMPFDVAPRPLLLGGRVFHGCTRTDAIVARDSDSGEEVWRTPTGGP